MQKVGKKHIISPYRKCRTIFIIQELLVFVMGMVEESKVTKDIHFLKEDLMFFMMHKQMP
jgi:hypothetical protein